MTYSDPTKRMAEIVRLLDQFPEFIEQNISPERAAELERASISRIQGYLLATEDYHFGDLEAVVDRYVKGEVPGMSFKKPPTPPEVAQQCARVVREKAEAQAMAQHRRKLLSASQPILDEPTPEERARGKALLLSLADAVAALQSEPDRAAELGWQKFNERMRERESVFAGEFTKDGDQSVSHSLLRSLGRTGVDYSVGDQEGRDD